MGGKILLKILPSILLQSWQKGNVAGIFLGIFGVVDILNRVNFKTD